MVCLVTWTWVLKLVAFYDWCYSENYVWCIRLHFHCKGYFQVGVYRVFQGNVMYVFIIEKLIKHNKVLVIYQKSGEYKFSKENKIELETIIIQYYGCIWIHVKYFYHLFHMIDGALLHIFFILFDYKFPIVCAFVRNINPITAMWTILYHAIT